MKGLTLTQPWATLVAVGAKGIETRSWRTHYRGPLAIHAAVSLAPVGGKNALTALVASYPFAHVLREHLHGYTPEEVAANLPRGAIVAIVELTDCRRVEADGIPAGLDGYSWVDNVVHPFEVEFGDYSPGRWAWKLDGRFAYDPAIECSGGRGLWDVPAAVQKAMELQRDPEVARGEYETGADEWVDVMIDKKLRERP